MADTQGQVPATVNDSARSMTLVVYVLYLIAPFTWHLLGIVGVIVAYVKRDEARGTIWESHVENQIQTFWNGLILFGLGILTIWIFGLGLLFWLVGLIYVYYRTIRGLLAAIDSKPYV